MSKYKRPFLITLAIAAVVGIGFWVKSKLPGEDIPKPPLQAKVEMLEGRVQYEKERAAWFEARAISSEAGEKKATARADSLAKVRKVIYIVKHETIRNSPNVGPDSLNRYFTAHTTSIYSDTTSRVNTP